MRGIGENGCEDKSVLHTHETIRPAARGKTIGLGENARRFALSELFIKGAPTFV